MTTTEHKIFSKDLVPAEKAAAHDALKSLGIIVR